MDKRISGFLLFCTTIFARACDKSPDQPVSAAPGNNTQVSMLSYEEQEAGTDLYTVRVLVSPDF